MSKKTQYGWIGDTVILRDGTEDLILGYDEDANETFSESRRWDSFGKETSGDTESDLLCHKAIITWKVDIGGYDGNGLGGYSVRVLTIKDQHLAALLAATYNDRVKETNTHSSFLLAMGPALTTVTQNANLVFMDEEARNIIESGDVFHFGWKSEDKNELEVL